MYVAVYVWIGVLIDFGLTMLLVLTAHWWTRPLLNVSPRKAQSSTPRWFVQRVQMLADRRNHLEDPIYKRFEAAAGNR